MATQRPDDVRAWLATKPSLEELRDAHPDHYAAVQAEIAPIVASGDVEALKAYVLKVADGAGRGGSSRTATGALVRRHVATAMLKQICATAGTGVTSGRVRFNLLNGWIAQRLLFERDLVRKPVRLLPFRLLWPLLWQRRFLMTLVGPKGIYCFYSRPLVARLAELIGDRSCLEIAAGDGTLARFLAQAGVDVVATDDHSWSHAVSFPDTVVEQDAAEALRTRSPQVVVCSWPPAGNPFERHVFTTPSVELYVVIGSRHRFASGDWAAYEAQGAFDRVEDAALSRLVLPPELDAAVHVFTRRAAPGG